MKAFMSLNGRNAKEFEELYPALVAVHTNVVKSIEGGEKNVVFQSLRRLERLILSHTSKLRDKPNRATKYALYLKQMISTIKLELEKLSDGSELEAYPTLSLIASHFLNIVLMSSFPTREPPGYIASNLSSYFKCLFSQDFEYVLDVIICSNTFDDAEEKAENAENNVGFNLLKEICGDDYIYLRQTSLAANAKYLTVLAGLGEAYQSKEGFLEFYKKLELEGNVENVQKILESKFKMDFGKKTLKFKELLEKIKTRKVANCIRRELQRKVDVEKSKTQSTSETTETREASKPPLFFIDVCGRHPKMSDGFPDIEIQDVEEVQDECGDTKTFPDISEDERNDEMVVAQVETSPQQATPATPESNGDSDSDIEIVHDDSHSQRRSLRRRIESDEEESDEEERDEADSESGEDQVPNYSDMEEIPVVPTPQLSLVSTTMEEAVENTPAASARTEILSQEVTTSQKYSPPRTRRNSSSASESPVAVKQSRVSRRSNRLSPVAEEVPLKRERRDGKRKIPFSPPAPKIRATHDKSEKLKAVEETEKKKRGRPAKVVEVVREEAPKIRLRPRKVKPSPKKEEVKAVGKKATRAAKKKA